MTDTEAYQKLLSGEAWIRFCDELKAAGEEILRPTAPNTPIDVAEGHRFLTQMLRSSLELIMEGGDAAYPYLSKSLHETLKLGWDNPDNIHHNAYISEHYDYKLSGVLGDSHYASIAVYGGSYSKNESGRRTVAYIEFSDLDVADDGSFEVILSTEKHAGNWICLEEAVTTLMIRETFWDRRVERPGKFQLERLNSPLRPPLSPEFVSSALKRATRYIRGSNKLFFDFSDDFRTRSTNNFQLSERERMQANQGIPDNVVASAWYKLAADEAAIIDFAEPECPYWMFVLSDYWGCSYDYRYRQIHTNKKQATKRADGSVRLIISPQDPGLADANWLDTAGHLEGVMQFRWLKCDTPLAPEVRIVKQEQL